MKEAKNSKLKHINNKHEVKESNIEVQLPRSTYTDRKHRRV